MAEYVFAAPGTMESRSKRTEEPGGRKTDSPAVCERNRVTPLLGGHAYFRALGEALAQVGNGASAAENRGHFIYVSGWLLNLVDPELPFELPSQNGPVSMLELLKAKACAGVDVRVLGWLSWSLGIFGRLDVRYENLANIRTIQALRQEPALAKQCCLNVIGHPAGAVHTKVIVAGKPGWATGFTGGIDLSADRAEPYWVDVQAQVEGPVLEGLYGLFRDMWNQGLAYRDESQAAMEAGGSPGPAGGGNAFSANGHRPRPLVFETEAGPVEAVLPGTSPVEARSFAHFRAGSQQVQSLRTLPRFHFAEPTLPELRVAPVGFAPSGLFEIRDALEEVILGAADYFYAEDQYFWSVEAMQWLNTAVRRHPQLKVVLVTGDYQPPGPPLPEQMPTALRLGLLPGLADEQVNRIAVYRRRGFVHAKTILVDDRWALIGSANLARRSLYTDVEHAIAVVDPDGTWVRDYRAALWGRNAGLEPHELEALLDPEPALGLWEPAWSAKPVALRLPSHFERLSLVDLPDPDVERNYYDLIADPDSRQPWFFPFALG